MARKSTGDEPKKTYSVRVEPKKHAKIVKKHGTFQAWIDKCVNKAAPSEPKPDLSKNDF